MAKIALIGAGSLVFTRVLVNDILSTPALRNSELVLMSRTAKKLGWVHDYVRRVIRDNNLPAKVSATLDRREALQNADYVITLLQVGGVDAFNKDYEIPLRYGVDLCVAADGGPAGVMRSLRTIPVMLDIARDIEEICPEALLLNYVNPMSPNCTAIGRSTDISYLGLCHGVQVTLDLISRYTDVPKSQIDYLAAGINHMTWFIKLESGGKDLYPALRKKIERPEYYLPEKVRCETMRHFGYFMTESSGHLSDYVPYFRKNRASLDRYCDQPAFGGESGAAPKNYERGTNKFRTHNYLADEPSRLKPRSIESCSYIIEALETGKPFRLSANVLNHGSIENLPPDCCVEVPLTVDGEGLHAHRVGRLPAQLAALCRTNINVHDLCAEACLQNDLELGFHAMALDPLTASVLSLEEIRRLMIEMVDAQREYLTAFDGQTLKPKPLISIPLGTQPVETPLDPALAVVHSLKDLATRKELAQREHTTET
jgi:alpha-galactosidase